MQAIATLIQPIIFVTIYILYKVCMNNYLQTLNLLVWKASFVWPSGNCTTFAMSVWAVIAWLLHKWKPLSTLHLPKVLSVLRHQLLNYLWWTHTRDKPTCNNKYINCLTIDARTWHKMIKQYIIKKVIHYGGKKL